MSDSSFLNQLQAEVDELRGRSGANKQAIKPKKVVILTPSEQREDTLFKARQEVDAAGKHKASVETEYRCLKEQIQQLNHGLEQMEHQMLELRKTAKETVADMRTGAWLSAQNLLEYPANHIIAGFIPEVNKLLLSEIKAPTRVDKDAWYAVWGGDVRIYNICGEVKNGDVQANTHPKTCQMLQQYIKPVIIDYNILCDLFDKIAVELPRLTLLIGLDLESVDELSTELRALIAPMAAARTSWLNKKQELLELEQGGGQPGGTTLG